MVSVIFQTMRCSAHVKVDTNEFFTDALRVLCKWATMENIEI